MRISASLIAQPARHKPPASGLLALLLVGFLAPVGARAQTTWKTVGDTLISTQGAACPKQGRMAATSSGSALICVNGSYIPYSTGTASSNMVMATAGASCSTPSALGVEAATRTQLWCDGSFWRYMATTAPGGTTVYQTPGSYTWTAPNGVMSATVYAISPGGGPRDTCSCMNTSQAAGRPVTVTTTVGGSTSTVVATTGGLPGYGQVNTAGQWYWMIFAGACGTAAYGDTNLIGSAGSGLTGGAGVALDGYSASSGYTAPSGASAGPCYCAWNNYEPYGGAGGGSISKKTIPLQPNQTLSINIGTGYGTAQAIIKY